MGFGNRPAAMRSSSPDCAPSVCTPPSRSTLSVGERRFTWLLKQHPKMSRDACGRWAFGTLAGYAWRPDKLPHP